MMNKQTSNF